MLRQVLVGVDGTEHGVAARDWAIGVAKNSDVLVVGIGLVDDAAIYPPDFIPVGGEYFKAQADESRLTRLRRETERALTGFSLACSEAGVASKQLEEVGEPTEQLLRELQRFYLLVLGQQCRLHGPGILDSNETIAEILRATPRPVVIVPKSRQRGSTSVIAYDGSPMAARAVSAFLASGLAAQAPVHLLGIGTDHLTVAQTLDRAAQYLLAHGVTTHCHSLSPDASIADTLLTKAQSLDADLLVMGSFGKPLLREFFLGSVTRQVVERAPFACFVYH